MYMDLFMYTSQGRSTFLGVWGSSKKLKHRKKQRKPLNIDRNSFSQTIRDCFRIKNNNDIIPITYFEVS